MNKIRFGLKALVAIAVIAAILLVAPSIGRFVPTHKIEQPVYCGSCHPEQVAELAETTHLGDFARDVSDAARPTQLTAADAISKGCQMCHNYWENFKWFGVRNFVIDNVEIDEPNGYYIDQLEGVNKPTDIYGNAVSPYGLGSTQSYVGNVTAVSTNWYHDAQRSVEPWTAGLDVYQWTNSTTGTKYTRLDYVWSQLSALSPGPVAWRIMNITNPAAVNGCGTAEKGLCHAAVGAVTASKREFPEFPAGSNNTLGGSGVFFTHEMAFTTAQYAAKPVKICGACHVFKLPPMRWGGEPWAEVDVRSASENNGEVEFDQTTDPFGFAPRYNDLVGEGLVEAHRTKTGPTGSQEVFRVAFRTPDWAHSNVPCIRCHAHAGIQGSTVSDNGRLQINLTTNPAAGEPSENDRPMYPGDDLTP